MSGCQRYSRSNRSSYIMAFWCDNDGKIADENTDLSPQLRQIEKFLKHCIVVYGIVKCHYLAKIRWFKRLDDSIRHCYGKPVEVWSFNLYVQECPATCISINKIKSRFVYTRTTVNNKDVLVISPRERYIL